MFRPCLCSFLWPKQKIQSCWSKKWPLKMPCIFGFQIDCYSLHRTEGTLNASTFFLIQVKSRKNQASPINNQTWPRVIDFLQYAFHPINILIFQDFISVYIEKWSIFIYFISQLMLFKKLSKNIAISRGSNHMARFTTAWASHLCLYVRLNKILSSNILSFYFKS